MNEAIGFLDGYMPSNAKTLVQAFEDGEIEVGDYITNYNTKLKNSSASVSLEEEETGHSGTQTYRVDNSTTWRVLGLSEDGKQLIITTGSPIKKVINSSSTEDWEKDPYLYLNSAEGWYHTNDELTKDNILDRICKIYDSNLAQDVRSMRIEDINNLLNLKIEGNKLYKIDDLGAETEINGFQSFEGMQYEYYIGNYAPENYLQEKYPNNEEYKKLNTKKAGDTVDGTAFGYQYTSENIIEQNSKLYDILFDETTSEEGNSKAYWLASPGVIVDEGSYCDFGPGAVHAGIAATGNGLFYSDGSSGEIWRGVRPVVYLNSNVTVDDLTVSKEGQEEKWTTTIPNGYTTKNIYYGQIR